MARDPPGADGGDRVVRHEGVHGVETPAHEVGEMLGRALLLPFDDHLDPAGQVPVVSHRAQRGRVDHDPALVVARSATEQAPVAKARRERRRHPCVGIGRRLDVVVRVEQGGAGTAAGPTEHGRMTAVDLEEIGVDAGLAQDVAGPFGARADVRRVVPLVPDGGDRDQARELLDHPLHVVVDAPPDRVDVHDGAGYRVAHGARRSMRQPDAAAGSIS